MRLNSHGKHSFSRFPPCLVCFSLVSVILHPETKWSITLCSLEGELSTLILQGHAFHTKEIFLLAKPQQLWTPGLGPEAASQLCLSNCAGSLSSSDAVATTYRQTGLLLSLQNSWLLCSASVEVATDQSLGTLALVLQCIILQAFIMADDSRYEFLSLMKSFFCEM